MSRRNNFSRNRSMTLEEEIETLSNLAIVFLRKKEPKQYYVKKIHPRSN